MDERLHERLDATRLLFPERMPPRKTVGGYDVYAVPTLRGLGIELDLVEVYSAAKKSELVTIESRHYLVFDNALSEVLNQLNSLGRLKDVDEFIAGALHRPIAEAMRKANEAPLYAFFVRRALEIKSIIAVATQGGAYSFDIFWQDLFVIYHEAAHGLDKDHALRKQLEMNAAFIASTMMNEVISTLTGTVLQDVLDQPASALGRDLGSWLLTKDDLELGDEAIRDAVNRVVTDPRFLDELACDAFAIACILDNLEQRRASYEEAVADEMGVDAIVACYRTFLNMRLLQYLDDIARSWREQVSLKKINPLSLRLLVEMAFRSNAFVLALLGRDTEAISPAARASLPAAIAAVQESHSGSLMTILNELLERTLLDPDFHARLDGYLAEDGFDPDLLASGSLEGYTAIDGFWMILAA